ncbi:hypothetical protein REH70_18230 [Cellulomonas sp. ATA003]|nr:hypothetical protein [Cellulomonas sp. ATA003]WNB87657.1 hypothetical protein REH70_18230 [Cellulomonas sp. ATA003]
MAQHARSEAVGAPRREVLVGDVPDVPGEEHAELVRRQVAAVPGPDSRVDGLRS